MYPNFHPQNDEKAIIFNGIKYVKLGSTMISSDIGGNSGSSSNTPKKISIYVQNQLMTPEILEEKKQDSLETL